jgi:cytoskeletal protein CcmA (bactofilin family)
MIRRNNEKAAAQQSSAAYTFLEKGTVINGDLTAAGHVRLDGQIHGNVTVRGNLEVSPGAKIKGEKLEVENLLLNGSIEANVNAKGKITISKSGRLIGDVRAASLDIESGAVFSGRSEMNSGAAQGQGQQGGSIEAGPGMGPAKPKVEAK